MKHKITQLSLKSRTVRDSKPVVQSNVVIGNLSGASLIHLLFLITLFSSSSTVFGQLVTVGGGILTSERSPEPVLELHGASPPFAKTRVYATLSWTDARFQPTVISAAEHTIIDMGFLSTGLGAGLLWLEANEYKPYPMMVSSTIVPLPLPRTSFVIIGSTLPFEEFTLSVVFKIGITLIFIE